MNFLAHLYLSGDNPHIQVGNFIGDHVKGRDYNKYAPDIRKGILLHRKIDHYTDTHPVVKQSIKRLNAGYGRYAGIVTDVFYDHFLGVNWSAYSAVPLNEYVSDVHKVLMRNYFKLPHNVKRFLPFIVKSRRLESYATRAGIERSLNIMARHSSLPDKGWWAMEQMDLHYHVFNAEFIEFFDALRQMVNQLMDEDL
ncbi:MULTISPECIES: ACP phosphodiesterase [unclassified Carboxylicivirga]|uniref:acyl carrier protein phosphodiesterase n=1 Tax=Carboxylicivirga TaxID=1628153 RepID=UPI003D332F9F